MSASTSWGERVCLLWKCITGAEEMLSRKGLAVWTEGWSSKPSTSGMLKTCPLKSGLNEGGARGVAQDFIIVKKKSSRTFLSKNAHAHERMLRHQLFCLLPLLRQTFNPWLVRDEMTPNGLVLPWRCTDFEGVHGLTEDCCSGFPHCTSFWKTPPYPTSFSFPPLPCVMKWLSVSVICSLKVWWKWCEISSVCWALQEVLLHPQTAPEASSVQCLTSRCQCWQIVLDCLLDVDFQFFLFIELCDTISWFELPSHDLRYLMYFCILSVFPLSYSCGVSHL